MYNYNFNTKVVKHVFDDIKYVVSACDNLQMPCKKEDAVVVELFNTLFVGITVENLGNLTIGGFNSETTGFFLVGYIKIYFSIHGEILYIRKRS